MQTRMMEQRVDGVNAALHAAGAEFQVGMTEVYKPNIGTQAGYVLNPVFDEADSVRPIIYPEPRFNFMEDAELAEFMEQIYKEKDRRVQAENINMSPETILSTVLPKVLSYERNAKELQEHGIPFVPIDGTDLLAVFYVPLESAGGTVTVTEHILQQTGLTVDEVYTYACSNVVEQMEIQSLFSVLAELLGRQASYDDEPDDSTMPLWVATTRSKMFGAGIFAAGKTALEMMASAIGADSFYLLPSSVHELLLVPDNGSASFDSLLFMVTDINATQVEMADQLTDNVYHYDTRSGRLTHCK